MTSGVGWTLSLLLVWAFQVPASRFSFDGVGLSSDFKTVAARFPHSTPQDQYVSLAPQDIHDHISAIEVSGTGRSRRVRIGFETRSKVGRLDYPTCAGVEAKLVAQYGRPQEIRQFQEEASPRADRVWRSPSEELTLLCFREVRGRRLLAEAVEITAR